MKLILAGAGVKEGDLSLRAYEEIKKADKVYKNRGNKRREMARVVRIRVHRSRLYL